MYLISLLTFNKLHCSNREQLNDPFDLNVTLSTEFLHQFLIDYQDKIQSQKINGIDKSFVIEKFKAKITDPISKSYLNQKNGIFTVAHSHHREFAESLVEAYGYKIISFAGPVKEHNQLLMWSHYATYDGVRLKFELPEEFDDIFEGTVCIKKVEYENHFPLVSVIEDFDVALSTKLEGWKYENEYRIITKKSNKLHFKKSFLKEITLGNKLSTEHVYLIIKLCRKLDYTCSFRLMKITASGIQYDIIDEGIINLIVNDKTDGV